MSDSYFLSDCGNDYDGIACNIVFCHYPSDNLLMRSFVSRLFLIFEGRYPLELPITNFEKVLVVILHSQLPMLKSL